jgi:hypothetical protein
MGSPLPKRDPFYECSTGVTGLAIALIDIKVILKITSAVNPIDAGTVALDAFKQHLSDGTQEDGCFFNVDRIGWCAGMNAGDEQGFIRVDVAQP